MAASSPSATTAASFAHRRTANRSKRSRKDYQPPTTSQQFHDSAATTEPPCRPLSAGVTPAGLLGAGSGIALALYIFSLIQKRALHVSDPTASIRLPSRADGNDLLAL